MRLASRSDEVDPEDSAITSWAEGVEAKVEPSDHKIVLSDDIWCRILKKVKPFKATGPDCIYGFFLKKIPAILEALREWIEVLNGLEVPSWLIEGRTRLIPKTAAPSNDPKDYHPIACLNTIYKFHVNDQLTAGRPRRQLWADAYWAEINESGKLGYHGLPSLRPTDNLQGEGYEEDSGSRLDRLQESLWHGEPRSLSENSSFFTIECEPRNMYSESNA